jgi:DnaJ-class molecular chaperone
MAAKKDPYEVLGVARDVDADSIRKTYRKLARQYHPDLNPGDQAAEERFKDISMAYEVLSDPEKRRNYDEFGEIALEQGFDAEKARKAREAFGERFGFAGGQQGGGSAEFQFGGIDDLLGRFFGGGRGEPGGLRMRGPDLETELELDFLEAVRGCEKPLRLSRPGADGGTSTETVTIRIPPGVDERGRLRVAGKGAPGIGGGPPGDLWARLRVRPHRVFRREGRNLVVDLPITVREAIQGARVEVPTLEGRATVSVPPGTDSGKRLRLRGKGIPGSRGRPAGDLFVQVQIRVPRDLDAETQSSLDRLARFEDPEIRRELFS